MPTENDGKYLEILRKIPPEKKLKSAFELYDFARQRITSEILRQNPKIDKYELKRLAREKFSV